MTNETVRSRRVVWREVGVADVEEHEVAAPKEGELLVRAHCTLISPGTERAFLLGQLDTPAKFPQYPGYSLVGEVAAVGGGVEGACPKLVEGFRVGDRVACAARHQQFVCVPADIAHHVPEGVSDEDAVFWHLAAISLQAVRKSRVELGESVVVVGAGLIGLFALQLAKLSGALPLIAVDLEPYRLDIAKQLGADAVVAADQNPQSEISNLTSGGAHVVIEATGHPSGVSLALKLPRRFGRVVLLGSTRGEVESVDVYRDIHLKGVTVIGAHNSARPRHESFPSLWKTYDDQALCLKLLQLRRLQVKPLLTHRFSWRQAKEAYDLLVRAEPTALGIVLDWTAGE